MQEQYILLRRAISQKDMDTFKQQWSPEYANTADPGCGISVLHYAVSWGRWNFVQFMLENGADPNVQTHPSEWTPLMFGMGTNHAKIIKKRLLLLKHGGNPYLKNGYGDNAFCENGFNYLESYLVVDLVCGGADDLPKDIWRVVKPFIYNI